MPTKSGALTLKERNFLRAYAEVEDRERAERKAGVYPGGGYRILARPEIQSQIIAHQSSRLLHDALPTAISTLISVMKNKKAPASARVQASKVVIDRAMPETEGGKTKELHEMTAEEIAASIASLESAASAKATDVTPADEGVFG